MTSVTGNADFASDFNLIFDPEAAHIALTAPWPKITAVGDVSNSRDDDTRADGPRSRPSRRR